LAEKSNEPDQREELLGNIHKLTRIVIERLEEGSKERTFSIAQIRLLGALGLRALRLWQETLRDGRAITSLAKVRDVETQLSKRLKETETGGEQS
jgi:hypothetical protein